MDKTGLGDRMKSYEKSFGVKLPIRMPVLMRIDGHSFHTMVKKWKCVKPFDDNLINCMQQTALYLCENISGCEMAYVQSDEITLLLRNNQTINTQPWFDNKLQKMVSISASMATNAFNYWNVAKEISHFAEFDSRAWVMPEDDVVNAFVWRQQDWTRNSIQMLARSLYSHKELHGKNCDELQDMIHAKGQNWNDLDTHKKRGTCIIKNPVEVVSSKSEEPVIRNRWEIDLDIPIFTKNREYISSRM